jgi:glycine betaine catabolism B
MNDTKFFRGVVLANGLIPLVILAWDTWHGHLGANPVNQAIHITGVLSLIFLLLSLVITPLRMLFGWNSLIAYRRALGLYGFFYAVLHLGIYVGLDRALDLSSTLEEIVSRRFLQIGFIAVILMVPLAITSTNGMIRRLGPKRWKLLHRLAYAVAILGVAHYYMLVKSDVRQPLAFAAALTPLLGLRVVNRYRELRNAKQALATRPKSQLAVNRPKFWKGKLRLASVFQETHNVKTFRFQSIDGGDLPFSHQAGQYLNVQLPINGKLVRRSYTIASSPARTGYCEITVKREEHGASSRYLHDVLQVGALLDISAPAGRFVFDDMKHKSVTLIAGGVGITPMMSTARYLTDRSWNGDIYFIFVARTPGDIIFKTELEDLALRFPNFKLLITLTDANAKDGWQGQVGRLSANTLMQFVPGMKSQPAFTCGPQGMMDATCDLLRQIGVPAELIFTEAFVSTPIGTGETQAVDEGISSQGVSSEITESIITFVSSQIVTTASSETNLLEAAEAAGVDLPFECRSGICGQCKVKCLEGSVFMPTRDALTAHEESQGYILACQALPRSGEVRIEA